MVLTDKQKRTIQQIVNIFETGKVEGDYGAVSVYNDGPDRKRQITYGAHQLTEAAGLKGLLKNYVRRSGKYHAVLSGYINDIGTGELVDNQDFKDFLKLAGSDPVMKLCQDEWFDVRYYKKALKWADEHGFKLPLSLAVIYDSWIHSGGILDFLRKRFPEVPPVKGGSEQAWLQAYVRTREQWLSTHDDNILRNTVYRPVTFKRLMQEGKWNLELPMTIRGLELK